MSDTMTNSSMHSVSQSAGTSNDTSKMKSRSSMTSRMDDKPEKQREKFEKLRKKFGASDSETFVTSFACSWKKRMSNKGRLYVSTSAIYFDATMVRSDKAPRCAFTDIATAEKLGERGIRFVKTDPKEPPLDFTSFAKRDDTLTAIRLT
eukprot:CAMPEP_0184724876 /NCGR_PEP_ID=MMETSP0314-20130426/29234_1 /TAXON_ID=38298 /ORGANISM="Rhodella maculata, Strain CCMP 736" /LENGTH=148 /DNA_ID=CAMNT_0027189967 /DNA_START=8 /DNA_END=451 /DNA_ORIENTATION=+